MPNVADLAEHLAAAPLFAAMSASDRLELAEKMRLRQYRKGEVIFHREDPAEHLYVIAAGTVKVSVPDESGREVVVALLRGGDVFGDLALFDASPRSATVTCLTETALLTLGRADFLRVLEKNTDAMRQMLALLASMVRRSTGHVEDLVFLDLPGRVAKCLLDLSEIAGDKRQLDLTQEDVAAFVGATRVSVNRVLADLERRGALRLGRGHIDVLDVPMLRSEIRY